MRYVKIPKKNGKFRNICIPNREEKMELRSLVDIIESKVRKVAPAEIIHGFTRGKSPVTNAIAHVGHKYVLSFDIKDFFDNVNEEKLRNKLSKDELSVVLVKGYAAQGLPTSPAVANLAAIDLDKAIIKWRTKNEYQFIYTRYADDLTFSFDNKELIEILKVNIPQFVKRCGFEINSEKTKLQSTKNKVVTGVGIDNFGIHPTRHIKRKLRAAIHKKNVDSIRGLEEWIKLKTPRDKSKIEKSGPDVEKLCKLWRLGKVELDKIPEKEDVDLGDNCIITGDIPYTLGMSTYTSGWTSCLSQPSGHYRKTVLFWLYLRGTRVAAYLSKKTVSFAGVERREMRARALVHTLRNGIMVYDRLYGSPEDTIFLRDKLEKQGIIFIAEAKKKYRGIKVVGHAPAKFKKYFDNLQSTVDVASKGVWRGKKVRSAYL